MDEAQPARASGKRAEPAQNFTAIGMRGHGIDFGNPRDNRDRLTMNSDLRGAIDQLTPASPHGLMSHEQHGVLPVRQGRRHVVQYASASCHPARRDDDGAAFRRGQLFRLLRGGDRLEACRAEYQHVLSRGSHLRVEFGDTGRVVPKRVDGHRAIDVHRHHRNFSLVLEPPQPVQQLFDAADGKRRNDQLAAAPHGVVNHLRQHGPVVVGRMIAIAIRRFHQHQVGVHCVGGIL